MVPNFSRPVWRKSERSGSEQNCVEVAGLAGAVAIRDSKDPDGPKLAFDPSVWTAFTDAAKYGKFDL